MWINNKNNPIGNRFPDLPPCTSVSQPTVSTRTHLMKNYIIYIDVKLCLSSAVIDTVQTVKFILIYLVLFPFRGWPQHDEQCHFADDSENLAVSILNMKTVSFYGKSKNDPNTSCLYNDLSGRVVEIACLWALACWDCGSVTCECCVLSGRDLCDGLIHRPEESYRVCVCVCVCVCLCVCVRVCVIECDQMQK
jgi:hypothetical protein